MSILIDQGLIVILLNIVLKYQYSLYLDGHLRQTGVVVTLRCKNPCFIKALIEMLKFKWKLFGPGRVLSFCSTRAILD